MIRAYLIGIHFEFSNNFDGHFLVGLCVSGSIDIAEGSITHLFGEYISFQARIPGHLVRLFSFFRYDSCDVCCPV